MNKVVINRCYGGFGLSDKALNFLEKRGYEVRRHDWGNYLVNEIERHNKDLIECVETLGEKESSGEYASLAIVEIYEDVYSIEEYDGMETIKTPETYGWTSIRN